MIVKWMKARRWLSQYRNVLKGVNIRLASVGPVDRCLRRSFAWRDRPAELCPKFAEWHSNADRRMSPCRRQCSAGEDATYAAVIQLDNFRSTYQRPWPNQWCLDLWSGKARRQVEEENYSPLCVRADCINDKEINSYCAFIAHELE